MENRQPGVPKQVIETELIPLTLYWGGVCCTFFHLNLVAICDCCVWELDMKLWIDFESSLAVRFWGTSSASYQNWCLRGLFSIFSIFILYFIILYTLVVVAAAAICVDASMCGIFFVAASLYRINMICHLLHQHILPVQCTICRWFSLHFLALL